MIKYSRLMMRYLAWNCPFLVDDFPLDCGVAVSRQVVQLAQRDPPHGLNRSNFNIPASMNIQTIVPKNNS